VNNTVAIKANIVLEVPTVEVAAKPATAEIAIGPSPSYAANVEENYARRDRSPVVIALPSVPVKADEDADSAFAFD
jgi:hypothetical protein